MHRSNSHRLSIFGCHVTLFALGLVGLIRDLSKAELITFRFDAEIHSVFLGFPFESGIEFDVGDVISGQFTFEPSEGSGGISFDVLQPHPFVLDINGVVLSTSDFQMQSRDNSGISDFEPASIIDSLELAAGGLADDDGMIGIEPELSAFRMNLFGPLSTLQAASHPKSVATWNELNLWREIQITFRDGSGGAIGFQATVGQFVNVPETSTFGLICMFAGIYLSLIRRHIFGR